MTYFCSSDHVLQTPYQGWIMAIVSPLHLSDLVENKKLNEKKSYCPYLFVNLLSLNPLQVMALLSGFAGVYTEVFFQLYCLYLNFMELQIIFQFML